ncbi:bifunctional diguanylate cyclase/phosphodiesterase [Natronosporangium hydrolyticum]|uniref:Bifunctional diguanylate cyclase/phosphodiesterase n=1 Tax=Natronosporangium hydrolyticum TaxID=2811111 RepID=A0A895YLS4_9ACTN|nr:bifunctional diguanylate cyclase/phosphodiesterase [Natronosporangium hydrolyticum]QSB16915.1 bifunctional diguanylate cyclase/phosphodiesterase [Natronosporangium hydrolyticum]
MTRSSGKPDQRLRLLVGLVLLSGALVGGVAGWVVGTEFPASPPPEWPVLASIAGLVAVGGLVNIDVRVRSTLHGVAWTDAAILIGLAIAPSPWTVLAALAGVLSAKIIRRRQPIKSAFGVAKDTITAGVGWAVLTVLGFTGSLDILGVLSLAVAFLAMTLVDELLVIPVIALSSRTRIWERFRADWDIRLLTLLWRFGVAIAAAFLLEIDEQLLYALPLAVILGHLWHERWVRAREERLAWQHLAEATKTFTGVDLDVVLRQAVLKGSRLFAADELEVEVWLGDQQRLVRGADEISYDGPPAAAPAAGSRVYAAPLHGYRGRRDIGVLRLRFRNRVKMSEREEAMVASYAAALDTAVRNAAAYRQLGEATEAHAYAAAHDALTGLANRRELERQLAEALVDQASLDSRIAVLLIDLRHFKEVNDTLGHLAGDRVLAKVAERLTSGAGPNDLVSRFGGDEFAVLLRSAWRPARVSARAQRVLRSLAEPIEVDGLPIMVEANGGLALAIDPQDTEPEADAPAADFRSTAQGWQAELLRRADVAMYQAKRNSRPLVAYTLAQDPADRDRLALAGQLPRAVSQREFILHFQPIAELGSGQVIGAEALARWRHPTRGELSPGAFLDLLERSTQLSAFTAAVLEDALAAAAMWRAAGHDLRVSVNISARSLLDASLPRQVLTVLEAHHTRPDRLCLELTETLAISQLDTVDQVLTQLHDIGVQLALDDFGTGFSSLAVLSRIPVDQLKVDRSFVQALADLGDSGGPAGAAAVVDPVDPGSDAVAISQAKAVVRSTVQLGRTLDLGVVAEGIEATPQRRLLWELGCPAGQGHLFGPPQPADELLGLLTRGEGGRAGAVAAPLAPSPRVVPLRQSRGSGNRSVG